MKTSVFESKHFGVDVYTSNEDSLNNALFCFVLFFREERHLFTGAPDQETMGLWKHFLLLQ